VVGDARLHGDRGSVAIPTINLGVMIVSIAPAYLASRAARRLDIGGVKVWLLVSSLISPVIPVLRWYELWALNVRWDSNAYGTAAWTIVVTHATLLLLDVADTIGLTLFFWLKRLPVKTFSDVTDNSFYWYFMVLIWVPLYVIVYLAPYVL
jgi:heme/copper-type cytochrome/quinol oxidase subunit 3